MSAASFRYVDLCLLPLNESSLYSLDDRYSSLSRIGTNHFSGRVNKLQHHSEWASPLNSSELLGLMSLFQLRSTFFSGPLSGPGGQQLLVFLPDGSYSNLPHTRIARTS